MENTNTNNQGGTNQNQDPNRRDISRDQGQQPQRTEQHQGNPMKREQQGGDTDKKQDNNQRDNRPAASPA